MKIKELHLRNIASIEKADIDFENDIKDRVTGVPASIFLIAGDTGTGKSVILDGISMALYKKTPRTVGVVNKTNNEYTDNEGESISVNSIEQYTRLGISEKDECYSELVFEGNDGIEYRARLELGLLKGKADDNGKRPFKHRAPKWTVKVGKEDWQKVESKTGQPILGAVGLTFEQFGRMAMLAQGQFASFLTGDKAEREQILEQLTNTEKFSIYGKAISNIFSVAKTNKVTAQTTFDTESAHTLKPDRLEELNVRLSELNVLKAGLLTEQEKESKTQERVKDIYSNLDNKNKAEERKTELEKIISGDDYKAGKSLVADWNSTDSERRILSEKKGAEQRRKKAENALTEAMDNFTLLSADLLFRMNEINQTKKEEYEIRQWIDCRSSLDNIYTQSDAVILQLRQYKETCGRLQDKEKALVSEKGKTESLEEKAGRLCSDEEKAKADVKAKQDSIDAFTEARNALEPDRINAGIKELNMQSKNLVELQSRMTKSDEKRTSLHADGKEIAADDLKLSELKKAYGSAEEEYTAARKKEDEARSLLSTMHMSVEDTLTELRQRLKNESADKCPLCGQHIDSLHIDVDFQHILSPLQIREEEAKAVLKEAELARGKAKGEYDTLKGAYENKVKAYHKSILETEQEEKSITDEAGKSGFDISVPLAPQISAAIEKISSELIFLEGKQKKAESLLKDINRIAEEKKPLDGTLAEVVKERLAAGNAVVTNKETIKRLSKEIGELVEAKDKLTATLSSLLNGAYPQWHSETQTVQEKLKADACEYRKKKEEAEKLSGAIEKAETLLSSLNGIHDGIITKHGEWDKPVEPNEYKTDNINKAWTALYSSVSYQDKEIETARQIVSEAETALKTYYESTGKTEEALEAITRSASLVEAARKMVSDTDSALKSCKDAIAVYAENIEKLLRELSVEKLDDVPDKELLEEKLAGLNRQILSVAGNIGNVESQLKANKENEEKVSLAERELVRATAVFEKWNRINNIFGGTRFRTLVQTYILRPLLNNANVYLEKITDRYTLTCSEDNDQLSILVLDCYNKNQVRSVTVLSGGERFMISLALSLALSSLNRQDMNVNILFIDEGFGTLDETNLNSVMSTLEKLQEIAGQSNRRVGIISHREELVERIPVKIRVRKKGEGRSHVEIINGGNGDGPAFPTS